MNDIMLYVYEIICKGPYDKTGEEIQYKGYVAGEDLDEVVGLISEEFENNRDYVIDMIKVMRCSKNIIVSHIKEGD